MIFTVPWNALLGGALLGLSCALLLLASGKIAGISSIISGLLLPKKLESSWRAALLLGMVISIWVVKPFGFNLPALPNQSLLVIIIAGLLVGFGSSLGKGCTSGHGIVGMGRLSKRSIVATLVFMGAAIVVVFLKQQLGAA